MRFSLPAVVPIECVGQTVDSSLYLSWIDHKGIGRDATFGAQRDRQLNLAVAFTWA